MVPTRKLPWLALVEVHFGNGTAGEVAVEDLLDEVVGDELFVGRVEPEPRRQMGITVVKAMVSIHDPKTRNK